MATITRTSILTNVTRTLKLPYYEQDEFERRLIAWRSGKLLLQEAFPEISADAREFIKTGITKEEWDRYVGADPIEPLRVGGDR
jgi:hypothetical protein